MATANAERLLARLAKLSEAAQLTPYALSDVALETIADVQASAAEALAGDQSQVGFDLNQFQSNIAQPGPLVSPAPGVGTVGILSPERMGTLQDFEEIAHVPGLYHQHTGDRAGTWEHVVYPNAQLRSEVAQARKAVWGEKTPQWLLLNDGFSGNGAFPPTPPHRFIQSATEAGKIISRLGNRFRQLFGGL